MRACARERLSKAILTLYNDTSRLRIAIWNSNGVMTSFRRVLQSAAKILFYRFAVKTEISFDRVKNSPVHSVFAVAVTGTV